MSDETLISRGGSTMTARIAVRVAVSTGHDPVRLELFDADGQAIAAVRLSAEQGVDLALAVIGLSAATSDIACERVGGTPGQAPTIDPEFAVGIPELWDVEIDGRYPLVEKHEEVLRLLGHGEAQEPAEGSQLVTLLSGEEITSTRAQHGKGEQK
jgi:hypothetical protein